MRIITGKFRGRSIHFPKGLPVRPTSDFAKTGLFNILTNRFDFESLTVLDLFAGTGNITYEFLSRGTSRITAVDSDFGCIRFVKETLQKMEASEARALRFDSYKFLEKSSDRYDIIFADPPFTEKGIERIPQTVLKNSLLNPDGWLILEHESKLNFDTLEGFADKRKYGKIAFSIFTCSSPPAPLHSGEGRN